MCLSVCVWSISVCVVHAVSHCVHQSVCGLYICLCVCVVWQCHTGILGGGHYVTYAKNPNNKWYCYNDSSCKVSSDCTLSSDVTWVLLPSQSPVSSDSQHLSYGPVWAPGRNAPLIHFWFRCCVCCWLGGRKGIQPLKNWVVGCWHGYLSWAQCRLAYGSYQPKRFASGNVSEILSRVGRKIAVQSVWCYLSMFSWGWIIFLGFCKGLVCVFVLA